MSLYSGNVRTDMIDPHTNVAGKKVEFQRNTGSGYYSNLRLTNIGVKIDAKNYNLTAGGYGLIKHAYLYDGKKEIDSTRFANRYLAFANHLKANSVNSTLDRHIKHHRIGFDIGEEKVITAVNGKNTKDQTGAQDEDSLVTLDLRLVFPLLNSMVFLDTRTFKNLKVVIEYEQDARIVLTNNAAVYTVNDPVLLADEIMDEATLNALAKEVKGAAWNCIEHDIMQTTAALAVAGTADTLVAEQVTKKKINGFDNKYVSRVVMMKTFTDKGNCITGNAVIGAGDMQSLAQHKEKLQARVNGRNLFSGDGIDHEGFKAKLLAMTFGDVNIAPYQNLESVGLDQLKNNSVHKAGVQGLSSNKQNQEVGQANFIGFSIEDVVNDLQFEYRRTNVHDDHSAAVQKSNEALDIHIYAEVRKQIQISGDNYQINYI